MISAHHMGFWEQVILIGILVFFSYLIGQNLRRRPEALSFQNLNKSFRFMGFLAIFLIGFVTFLILMLPASPGPAPDGSAVISAAQRDSSPSRPARSL